MKPKYRRPSPTMVIAIAALFFTLGGGALAANHYLITSTKQIKPSVLKALKGAKGPRGATGVTGAQGATGTTGAQGPSGVVTIEVFSGNPTSIAGGNPTFVFAGGTTSNITTTASQRLTGSAVAALGSSASTSGQVFTYDLCYQASTGGSLYRFTGAGNGWAPLVYSDIQSFAAAASVVPGAGTWKIGFCVRNHNINPIDDSNGYVNGWVQVTN